MDYSAHRREMLRHCLWMLASDVEYALDAADRYERESEGVLEGLGAKVRAEIERKRAEASKARQRQGVAA